MTQSTEISNRFAVQQADQATKNAQASAAKFTAAAQAAAVSMQESAEFPFNKFSSLPSIGDLESFIRSSNQMPLLTTEQEIYLGRRVRDYGDEQAAGEMAMSHMRLVISIARQFNGYSMPREDMIQEGNIGLLKAIHRFDPDHGVRLVSYAIPWIRAEIKEYVVKNLRMVRLATTKAHRKLFFGLRSSRSKLQSEQAMEDYSSVIHLLLTDSQVSSMAIDFDVTKEDVREMEMRLNGGDFSMDADPEDESSFAAQVFRMGDEKYEPTAVIECKERENLSSVGVSGALDLLDGRSRRIVEQRWLDVDDSGHGMTLHELAFEYGVSAERIRQIEANAMKKMRMHLEGNKTVACH